MTILRKTIAFGLIPLLVLTSLVLINDEPVVASIGGPLPPGPEKYYTLPPGDYIINSDTWVPVGKTLNLSAGVNLLFPKLSYYDFEVFGTLNVRGTPNKHVNFRSDGGTKEAGDYGDVIVNGGKATFNYTNIEHADIGLKVINAAPVMNYCNIRESNYGIDAEQSSYPKAYNLSFRDVGTRDIKLDNSRLDIHKGLFEQSSTSSSSSIELKTGSYLKIVNATFEDKYSQLFRMNGGSTATLINTIINFTANKLTFQDAGSKILLKNFLDIFVGYKNNTNNDPLPGTDVYVRDDSFARYSRQTDLNGELKWLVAAYLSAYKSGPIIVINNNKTDIEINHEQIFKYTRENVDMSTSHREDFINHVPEFNLSDNYTLQEDSNNDKFLDLWEVVEDDFDTDDKLTFELYENNVPDFPEFSGEPVADIFISNDPNSQTPRYLNIDLTQNPASVNWTGEFTIRIETKDLLGQSTDVSNISAPIKLIVEQINDAPVWLDMFDFWMDEDTNLFDAINLVDHVYDNDTPMANITFELLGYDKTNFSLLLDGEFNLDIQLLNEHYNGYTDLIFSAYDEDLFGNYTARINVRPEQDEPEINRSLVDFPMEEDTKELYSINLHQVFTDHDGENLTFSSDGNVFINVTIDQVTGEITFEPIDDWFGEETITFYGNDSFEHASDTMVVTVNNINDPPDIPIIVFPDEDSDRVFRVGEPILFVAVAYDPDIHHPYIDAGQVDDVLKYSWEYNNTLIPRLGDNFTYPDLPEGSHRVKVTVTDLSGASSSAFVDVTVFGSYTAPIVKHISPLPDFWTNVPNVKLEWSVEADPVTLPFVRYDILLDENENPTTVVAEKIATTSYIVTGLRNGAKYHWTIVPYVIDTQGTDLDGVWYFSYDEDVTQFFDLNVEVNPGGLELFPGDSGTVKITVTNKGNMPDRYTLTVKAEPLVFGMVTLNSTELNGEGDNLWGLMYNEKESFDVFFSVPEDFDVFDTYEVTIEVRSIHKDKMEPGIIDLTIKQIEDRGNITPPAGKDNTLLLLVLILIIVIIAAIGIIMFAVHHKHKKEEDKEDEEEDEVHEELVPQIQVAPGVAPVPVPAPAPLPVPAPAPAPMPAPAPAPVPAPAPAAPAEAVPAPESGDAAAIAAPAAAAALPAPQAAGEQPAEDFGTVMCGPCGASIPLTSKDRPLDVICQDCGNSFTVKS